MAGKNDTTKVMHKRKAQSIEAPVYGASAFSNGNHAVNNHQVSGCGYGKIVIGTGRINSNDNTVDHSTFFMKQGWTPESEWCPLANDAGLSRYTPSAYSNARSSFNSRSDRKPLAQSSDRINAVGAPVVAVADLGDRASVINQNHLSGKNRYTFVIGADETDADSANWIYTLYMATGLEDVSDWVDMSGSIITPAGSAMPSQGTLRSDRKPKMYAPIVTSVGFTIIEEAELADAAGGINVYGKLSGACVIAVDDEEAPTTFKFYHAVDSEPTGEWRNLDGVSATVVPA